MKNTFIFITFDPLTVQEKWKERKVRWLVRHHPEVLLGTKIQCHFEMRKQNLLICPFHTNLLKIVSLLAACDSFCKTIYKFQKNCKNIFFSANMWREIVYVAEIFAKSTRCLTKFCFFTKKTIMVKIFSEDFSLSGRIISMNKRKLPDVLLIRIVYFCAKFTKFYFNY